MEIATKSPDSNIYKGNSNEKWGLISGIMGTEIKSVIDLSRYHSDDLEYNSPFAETQRQRLVSGLFELHSKYGIGRDLWCSSLNLKEITDEATNHRALLRVYDGINLLKEPIETREIGSTWGDFCLTYLLNSIGARNRYRRVKEVLRQELMQNPGEFKALSVAAGSSSALMTVVKEEKDKGRDNIHLTLVDQNPTAELDAGILAHELGITDQVTFIKKNVFWFNRYLEDRSTGEKKKFNFIEVVGLLDYLDDRQFVRLIKRLRESLVDGGSILYSNIAPNSEKTFIEQIVGWTEMYYRLVEEILNLGRESGFTNIKPIDEPASVYNLGLARR